MSRRLVILIIMTTAAMFLVAGLTAAGILRDRQDPGCHLTQPVYSASYTLIGTWQATLPLGRSVTLPDGDTATCTRSGLSIR